MPEATADSIPVIVFSHGLGHSRIYFRDIAEHLATYGFAVAMPEHVGSNESQRQAIFKLNAAVTCLPPPSYR